MPQRPETPLKDLAGTLRTILRTNKAAAEALVQIQEIEALAEDRLRPLMPELRVIKDEALAAARELDTAKLAELPFRLRDLVIRAGAGQDGTPGADAAADRAPAADADSAPEDLPGRHRARHPLDPGAATGHASDPSVRILPPAAPPDHTAADHAHNSPKHVAEALYQLHELLAAGVLDQVEHDAKKRELLGRL